MFPVTRPLRQTGLDDSAPRADGRARPLSLRAIAWRINQPGHVRDVEIELGRKLGMQVSLDEVSYPGPGEVVYRGLVLRGQEPRGKGFAEIARADVGPPDTGRSRAHRPARKPQAPRREPRPGLALLDSIIQRSISHPVRADRRSRPPRAGSTWAETICNSRSRRWPASSWPILPRRP